MHVMPNKYESVAKRYRKKDSLAKTACIAVIVAFVLIAVVGALLLYFYLYATQSSKPLSIHHFTATNENDWNNDPPTDLETATNRLAAMFAAKINLATHVTGVLPIEHGGTNSNLALSRNRFLVTTDTAIVQGTSAEYPAFTGITLGLGVPLVPLALSEEHYIISTPVPLAPSFVDGVLPVEQGGTNNNALLVNGRLMVSTNDSMKEGTSSSDPVFTSVRVDGVTIRPASAHSNVTVIIPTSTNATFVTNVEKQDVYNKTLYLNGNGTILHLKAFDYFDTIPLNGTWSGPCSINSTIYLVRIGSTVTMRVPRAACVSILRAVFTFSARIPMEFLPVSGIEEDLNIAYFAESRTSARAAAVMIVNTETLPIGSISAYATLAEGLFPLHGTVAIKQFGTSWNVNE